MINILNSEVKKILLKLKKLTAYTKFSSIFEKVY